MKSRNSVRLKLLRATLGIWILVTLFTLGAVAGGQYRSTLASAHRIESYFRQQRQIKGQLLVANQALALRAMAADNAFNDVANLVHQTVEDDADVIYGAYVDVQGVPWAVVTPNAPDTPVEREEAVASLRLLPSLARVSPTHRPRTRTVAAFGANVEEHAADVWDGTEHLGIVRYGISMARSEAALRQELAVARNSLFQVLGFLVALGLAGMALGVIAIRRIANHITQPLAELARASEELGRG